MTAPLVSVVLPCHNEETAIGFCVREIAGTLDRAGIPGEVIVCDNASTDRTAMAAAEAGARVVAEPALGYGNAYRKGFSAARGRYLIMGDGDGTYDFTQIPAMVALLESGREFVSASRYADNSGENIIFLHRLVGNPMFTFLTNAFFGTRYTDVYSGFRAFTREAYDRIAPKSRGMEFNLELAIGAGRSRLAIEEIPTRLRARRGGVSKLNAVRDGLRSLGVMFRMIR